jgi:hypothetical protein
MLIFVKVDVDGVESSKSMRLLEKIQGQDILIMVDFDSSHTFAIRGWLLDLQVFLNWLNHC